MTFVKRQITTADLISTDQDICTLSDEDAEIYLMHRAKMHTERIIAEKKRLTLYYHQVCSRLHPSKKDAFMKIIWRAGCMNKRCPINAQTINPSQLALSAVEPSVETEVAEQPALVDVATTYVMPATTATSSVFGKTTALANK